MVSAFITASMPEKKAMPAVATAKAVDRGLAADRRTIATPKPRSPAEPQLDLAAHSPKIARFAKRNYREIGP